MDRFGYIAMTGAKNATIRQGIAANNLANAATVGFRADTHIFRSVPVVDGGLPVASYAVAQTPSADFTPGVLQQTNRPLDVALENRGFIAVETPSGEAYTRRGDLQVSAAGFLQTRDGKNIVGDGGPINIPADSEVAIAKDGTISAIPSANRNAVVVVGRIKLVNPDEKNVVKGSDGLFRMRDGSVAEADPNVKIASGALEGSNVNVVESMVEMISLARQFDAQVKLIQTAEANRRQLNAVLNMNG